MVFTTTNLFKGIPCPYAPQCTLTNCIFSHELRPRETESHRAESNDTPQLNGLVSSKSLGEPAAKRRKVTYDSLEDKPPSKADKIRAELAAAKNVSSNAFAEKSAPVKASLDASLYSGQTLPSLARPVTPPPTSGKSASHSLQGGGNIRRSDNNNVNNSNATSSKSEPGTKENLNPRMIPNDPAGHARRSLYLKYLHLEMVRLNQKVSDAPDHKSKHSPVLNPQQLVKMALDEEEKIGKDQPLVYANIVKQRIASYKKMNVADWANQVKCHLEKDEPKTTKVKGAKPLNTGLSTEEELLILPYLVADQTGLEKFGYITSPPTKEQAAEAAAAVTTSKNFEVCDRCTARFQVFPDRREDGLLTSNGPCKYHPNKKVFPNKTRGDVVSGFPKEPYHPCCNNVVGSDGCTETDFHVFKTSSAARLASILPFITTPENRTPSRDKHGREVSAVTFDCEMGYTTQGLELIRLTAVSWPLGEELVDVLVRPLGIILDLNSRFSGVWPESFSNAIPYSQYQDSKDKGTPPNGDKAATSPPIVESPQKARELLCSFLTPKTPLIGHAIDNDLNSVRLCHPSIIDTVLLFPHPRGMPLRLALRMLSSNYLGRIIQTGGDRGHDSLEDAQATGDLVRFKIGERWKVLQSTGWRIEGGKLVPPATARRIEASGEMEGSNEEAVGAMVAKIFDGQLAGKKRRKKRAGNGADENTEDEEVPLGNGVAAYLKHATQLREGDESKDM